MESRPQSIQSAAKTLLTALVEASRGRPEVSDALRSMHTWLGQQLEGGADPLHEKVLHQGDGRRVTTLDHSIPSEPVADLDLVMRRAQWKADALRLAWTRRDNGGDDAELQAQEEELRTRIRSLPECFPWMLDGPMPLPADESVEIAANSYDALSRVAEVAHGLEVQSGGLAPPSDLLYLMAEAQSGVLVAVRNLGLRGDSDQRDLFAWLKDQTTRHRVYVDRHMRLDDPADPSNAGNLLERINAGSEEFQAKIASRKDRGTLLNKLQYHASRTKDGVLLDVDRESIAAALEKWGELGLSGRDRGLVELAQELAGKHPDDQALRCALEPFLEGHDSDSRVQEEGASPDRDLLAEARELLGEASLVGMHEQGQEVDFAGLEQALGLKTLAPLAIQDLSDAESVRALVAALETDLILLGVRLESEAYSALKQVCASRELLFVRLPDGFDPEQVAKQVLRQVGWRLRKGANEPQGVSD